jgi:hypothetical protein
VPFGWMAGAGRSPPPCLATPDNVQHTVPRTSETDLIDVSPARIGHLGPGRRRTCRRPAAEQRHEN